MIVDDDDVEGEICLLRHRTANGVSNRPHTIPNRNDDRRKDREILRRRRHRSEYRFEPRSNPFQMRGDNLLHLDLIFTMSRVDIIKKLLTTSPPIDDGSSVERFRQPQNRRVDRELQAQVVESTPLQFQRDGAVAKQRQTNRLHREKEDRSEIESVPQASNLIVDQRMIGNFRPIPLSEIGVEQTSPGLLRHLQVTSQRLPPQLNSSSGKNQQQVIGLNRVEQPPELTRIVYQRLLDAAVGGRLCHQLLLILEILCDDGNSNIFHDGYSRIDISNRNVDGTPGI